MRHDGILAADLAITERRRPGLEHRVLPARVGLVVEHRPTGVVGAIVKVSDQVVVVRDRRGRQRSLPLVPGAFTVDGQPVHLVAARGSGEASRPKASHTPSGSRDAGPLAPRVARGSRIFVEGEHDAELIERIWGDDLRYEGVVVEPMAGADDVVELVRAFSPGPDRRLGVLLDHLVEGSKEARLAAAVEDPWVLVTGHPFVDIWQAVKPRALGVERWPDVPPGRPWKEGVVAALGYGGSTADFWRQLLGRVHDYRDLEPALLSAVEQLIDFVAPP